MHLGEQVTVLRCHAAEDGEGVRHLILKRCLGVHLDHAADFCGDVAEDVGVLGVAVARLNPK